MTPTADIETRRRILEAMLPFVTDEDRMVLDAGNLYEDADGNTDHPRDGTPCRACLIGWAYVARRQEKGHKPRMEVVDADLRDAVLRLGIAVDGDDAVDAATEATRQGRAADVVREALRALDE